MSDSSEDIVYLHLWTGDEQIARAQVAVRFPKHRLVALSHRELRDLHWRDQIRTLAKLRGHALVFYFEDVSESKYRAIFPWTALIHGCTHTVVADASGLWEKFRRRGLLILLPSAIVSGALDVAGFLWTLVILAWLNVMARPIPSQGVLERNEIDVAYLYPVPADRPFTGGAFTHIRGVLSGLISNGVSIRMFSAYPFESLPLHPEHISPGQRVSLFWEAKQLVFNLRFAREVTKRLKTQMPRVLYQRHSRFVFSGALISRWLKRPLVLEYNGSEVWFAQHWDRGRFSWWLRLCEEVTLKSAVLIVVVSEPLRQGLLQRGVSDSRIVVNPNGVDAEIFAPGCGGAAIRAQLTILDSEVLVGFVGSFGPWHGLPILAAAIQKLMEPQDAPLRFVLIGDGIFHTEVKRELSSLIEAGRVCMTGAVPYDQVPEYMDACDVLVSPHVPMPDGRPFIGSPTKLFEYMAMAKGIVASRLDQIADVLEDGEDAILVEPANVDELVAGIRKVAQDPELRRRLGETARKHAAERHSWTQNARNVLQALDWSTADADSHRVKDSAHA